MTDRPDRTRSSCATKTGAAASEQTEELLDVPRAGEVGRRAAQPEPDVRGERLIRADDLAKVVE